MSVIIIDANKINYSELEYTHSRFRNDKIEEELEDIMEVISTPDILTGMEMIVEKCNFDKDELIYTTIIYESQDEIYYMIHTVDDNDIINEINKVGIYLSRDKYKITGKIGILKEKIIGGETKYDIISKENIYDIYCKTFIHRGVIIDDNKIDEIRYIHNPMDWIKPDEASGIRFIEYEIFDKILMMFIELKPKKDTINELASVIYGKKVNGRVMFALRRKGEDLREIRHIYEDLSIDIVNKMLCVLSVNPDELRKDSEEAMKAYNFYTIIKKRYEIYKFKYGTNYQTETLKKISGSKSINEQVCEPK